MLAYLKCIPIGKGRFVAEYEGFKLKIDEQEIALFTADRPEKMNVLDGKSWAEINDFFFWADQSDEVEVVITTGTGDEAFITGADLNSLKMKKPTDYLGGAGQRALNRIQRYSKPVIVAVNGYALGGGCETAIACDSRMVSENVLFILPETGLGIPPDAGGTQRLSRLIGLGRVADVILMGRKIGAREATEIGLATECVPQRELLLGVKKIAGKPIAKGSVAPRVAKQVVTVSLSSSQEAGGLPEILALSTFCGTGGKMEGTSSLLEKRTPDCREK